MCGSTTTQLPSILGSLCVRCRSMIYFYFCRCQARWTRHRWIKLSVRKAMIFSITITRLSDVESYVCIALFYWITYKYNKTAKQKCSRLSQRDPSANLCKSPNRPSRPRLRVWIFAIWLVWSGIGIDCLCRLLLIFAIISDPN